MPSCSLQQMCACLFLTKKYHRGGLSPPRCFCSNFRHSGRCLQAVHLIYVNHIDSRFAPVHRCAHHSMAEMYNYLTHDASVGKVSSEGKQLPAHVSGMFVALHRCRTLTLWCWKRMPAERSQHSWRMQASTSFRCAQTHGCPRLQDML